VSLLFIDGGHTEQEAFGDFKAWAGRVLSGGICAYMM
jgi:hypothetical protein